MADLVLIDNDVILKACCYASTAEILDCLAPIGQASVLGTLQFVLPRRISRSSSIANKEAAAAALHAFLAQVPALEPEDDEIALASTLEAEAVKRQIALDSGESQLLAILVIRALPLLVTGDKRAIAAIEVIAAMIADRSTIDGKIACLEQLIHHCLRKYDPQSVKSRVCAERHICRCIPRIQRTQLNVIAPYSVGIGTSPCDIRICISAAAMPTGP